ncbi:hypothetical protein SVAN01_03297 [Stagonosporopsis vannaccii]|nr:hypothetical protein SVAN01_03297 [Stagonosporopsis vannaccii]
MKLPFELALMFSSTLAAPLTPRAATFPQLAGLTSNARDVSTTDKRWPEKYFHESVYHPHYDGRFADIVQPRRARLFHMRLLLRAYMAAMNRAGVRTWIMHGSLLGWWWNQGVFPWDSDLDFCVEETGMLELGAWWNMTVHSFTAEDLGLVDASKPDTPPWDQQNRGRRMSKGSPEANDRIHEPPGLKPGVWDSLLVEGKKYLLEINPHATDPSTSDPHNKIDARWIDTATGLFIDITTVHPVPSSTSTKSNEKHMIFLPQGGDTPSIPEQGDMPEEMYTKDTHLYTTAALFPLRQARFEGTGVWVPYAYEQLLVEEYGPRALVETWFNGWQFDRGAGEWVAAPEPGVVREQDGGAEGAKKGSGKKTAASRLDDKQRHEKDNEGETKYSPTPGRKGDVHVVPPGE